MKILHIYVRYGAGHNALFETFKIYDDSLDIDADEIAEIALESEWWYDCRDWCAEWENVDSIPEEWLEKEIKNITSNIEYLKKELQRYSNVKRNKLKKEDSRYPYEFEWVKNKKK